MDHRRVTQVRKKTGEGNFTAPVPIGAKAENITLANGTVLQDAVDELQHGKAGHEVLTYAQWNSLSKEEKDNGTVYFITDHTEKRQNVASLISFDNTENGINATNVQTAIEAVNRNNAPPVVNNLNSMNPDEALSANQGRILNESIQAVQDNLNETKQDKIVFDNSTNQVLVGETDLTMPTNDVYYQIGTQSFTFEANSTYLICAHVQVIDTTSAHNGTLTFSLGVNSSDTGVMGKKITAKPNLDTSGARRYSHFSTIIHFDTETTYYGWLASSIGNYTAKAYWQMQCIKIN